MLHRMNKRTEPIPRYGLSRLCRGRGVNTSTGAAFEYRGVDVSIHGLGCVVIGPVKPRDTLEFQIGSQRLHFEVMWSESHLGIENTYRIGLHCLDRGVDVRSHMSELGLVTHPVDDDFVA